MCTIFNIIILAAKICGIAVVKPNITDSGRIINGTESNPGSWPWAVSQHQRNGGVPGGEVCGAAVITSR